MKQIINARDPVRTEVWTAREAVEYYRGRHEPFKLELIDRIPEGEDLRMYWHGDWQDLCRGPHLQHTGQVPADAFKLTHVAGAYWLGDASRPMLQRIYGVAFRNRDDLKAHLTMLEEAAKRDHRKLGREMELFHLQEEAPGMVFWHPNGWTIYRQLEDYMRGRLRTAGYKEIKTPQVVDRVLVGEIRPLGGLPREHVHRRGRRGRCQGKAHQRAEADELPLPCAGLQPGPEVLPRPALAAGGVRVVPPV